MENQPIELKELNHWKEFIDLVHNDYLHQCGFVFRGQKCSDWKIKSSLQRYQEKYPTTLIRNSKHPDSCDFPPATPERHLRTFKELVRPQLSIGLLTELNKDEKEWWALAQHHGLATPLIDWTRSPYIALYFAFEEKFEQNKDSGKHEDIRTVIAIGDDICNKIKEYDNECTDKPGQPLLFVPRLSFTKRLVAQQGLLMLMDGHPKDSSEENLGLEDDIENIISQRDIDYGLRFITINIKTNEEERIECLKMLDRMNINRASLFPDIDGAARYVNNMWELDFDTTVGRF